MPIDQESEGAPTARHRRATWISSIGELDQHLGTAALGRAPADEVLAAQLVERRRQGRLAHDPGAAIRDDLVAR
jgi:hypothetical protein